MEENEVMINSETQGMASNEEGESMAEDVGGGSSD